MSSAGFQMAQVAADVVPLVPHSNPWEGVKETKKPLVVAHRCGKNNGPENTLRTCQKALKNGAEGLEVDVQVTTNGELVLYRGDLSKLDARALAKLTRLSDFLREIPQNIPIILDLKSPLDTAETLVQALQGQLSPRDYPRLLLYATHQAYHPHLKKYLPDIRSFEPRELTRQRLLDITFGKKSCEPKGENFAIGYEVERKISLEENQNSKQLCEDLQLGKSCTTLPQQASIQGLRTSFKPWHPWNKVNSWGRSPTCFSDSSYHGIIVYFATGIEDKERALGFYDDKERCFPFAHVIMTDYPKEFADKIKKVEGTSCYPPRPPIPE